jgi:hypothetical protein
VVRSSTHSLGMGFGILAVATHDGRLGTPLSGILGRGIGRGKLDRGGLWCVPSGERTDRAASKRALRLRTSENSVKRKFNFGEHPF